MCSALRKYSTLSHLSFYGNDVEFESTVKGKIILFSIFLLLMLQLLMLLLRNGAEMCRPPPPSNSYPKTIIILSRPRNRAIQHRSPKYSRERLHSATTNPKAQRISAARIIIGVGETNVSFGPRFLDRSVSRQAIFPLSRVTQPRRHNSFLSAITTRDETSRAETRRRGSRRYTRCCAR